MNGQGEPAVHFQIRVPGQAARLPYFDEVRALLLVAGIPRQRFEGARSLLEIPLVTGHCVVHDADAREFSLQIAPS